MTQNPNPGQNSVQNQPSRPQFRPMQRPPNAAGVRPTFQARPTRPASAGNPLVRPSFRPMSAGNSPERPAGFRPVGVRPVRPTTPSPQLSNQNANTGQRNFAAGIPNSGLPAANGNVNGNGYPVQSPNTQPSQPPAENPSLSHQMSSMSLSSTSSKNRAKRVYTSNPPVASAQFNPVGPNPALAGTQGQPQFSPAGANTFQSSQPNQFQQPGPQAGGIATQPIQNQYQPQVGVPGMPRPGIPFQQQPVMNGQPQYRPGMPQAGMNGQQAMPQAGMGGQNPYQPGMQQPGMAPPNQYQPGAPGQQNQYPGQPNQFSRAAAPQQPGYPNSQPPPQKIDPDQIPSAVAVRAEDQVKFGTSVFATSSRGVPPIATTHFRATDEGSSNPRFIRSTLYNLPTTEEVLKNSFMPMAVMIQPLADLAPEEEAIPVVDFGSDGPLRCSRCQAYVNPFFQFINGGRLFLCNLCGFSNEVPASYFANLDMNGRRIDLQQRAELLFGSCEFAVQDLYCARPPQPVSYLFAVDVSWNAQKSGMLQTWAAALKHFLYSGQYTLPAGCTVGIITFDRTIHFYNLSPELESFSMLLVGDIEDVFSPIQKGLLVDPVASRTLIESLLDSLPTLYGQSKVGDAAMGAACKAGFEALKKFGGKLSIFQTMLPLVGEGTLQNREDQKILGTDKERNLFEPQSYFWTKLGQECAVNGVSVDLYLFPSAGYIDVSTVGALAALSGGEVQLYSNFDANRQGMKFANDMQRTLGRTFGFEALLRIRVSNGLRIDNYMGNFFMKNATDIELAGVDSLKSFTAVLKHDGKLDERQDSYIQAALLYTTSDGFRRVRVHNLAISAASQLSLVFRSASLETCICVMAREMIQEAMTTALSTIRTNLSNRITKILSSYRKNCASASSPGQLILPDSFKLSPLFGLALLKTRAFRAGRVGSSDLRMYSMRLLNSLGVGEISNYLYPTIYDCTTPDAQVGTQSEEGLKLFPIVRASVIRLRPNGVYIAENGRHLFLYLGKEVEPKTLLGIFGVDRLEAIPITADLPTIESPHNTQLRYVISYLRTQRPRFLHLNICRQGLDQVNEVRFSHLLIEDANFDNSSYVDYLIQIHRAIQSEISKSN